MPVWVRQSTQIYCNPCRFLELLCLHVNRVAASHHSTRRRPGCVSGSPRALRAARPAAASLVCMRRGLTAPNDNARPASTLRWGACQAHSILCGRLLPLAATARCAARGQFERARRGPFDTFPVPDWHGISPALRSSSCAYREPLVWRSREPRNKDLGAASLQLRVDWRIDGKMRRRSSPTRTTRSPLAAALFFCVALLAAAGPAASADPASSNEAQRESGPQLGTPGGDWAIDSAATTALQREAYATLLYSDDFLLGVRVLGQSLRETGTVRCVPGCSSSPGDHSGLRVSHSFSAFASPCPPSRACPAALPIQQGPGRPGHAGCER